MLNGRPQVVRGDAAFLTVAEYLRFNLGQCGTKVVCAEGDCGACTVLVGRAAGDRLRYLPVDCCIQFVFQVDGCHVVTVEGLGDGELHLAQKAMIDGHGSQCGYCTPGVVMALAGWAEAGCDRSGSRIALSGNLCRCTGYLPIFAAADALADNPPPSLADRFAGAADVAELRQQASEALLIDVGQRRYFAPTTLDEAVAFKGAHPSAAVIAGATELGVWRNKRGVEPGMLLSLTRVPGLDRVERQGDQLIIGATATWSQIEPAIVRAIPSYRRMVERFGSPQIRHVATLAGNIANGSPIADSLGLLSVMDAELEIAGPRGRRRRPMDGFYAGYKKKDLAPDELIVSVGLPLPRPGDRLRFTKVSRRTDLDIATFGAAIRIRETDGIIESAAVALTGVAPTVVRASQAEAYLVGRPFAEEAFREAGRIARQEIKPITDVRGSRDFRLQLTENVFAKFYCEETQHEGVPA